MKFSRYLLILLFSGFLNIASAQQKISELSVVYETMISTGNKEPKLGDAFDGATITLYLKGAMSRSEMVSALASSTTIHDANTGTSTILQEVSGQKLLIRMSAENWKEKNQRYEGITFTKTQETKTIAGYTCTKAIAKMKDGSTFTVFYTSAIVPENNEYNYQFRTLAGLPLEYELSQGNLSIKYLVTKINLNPVPASMFDIPTNGYRELSYAESRQLGIAQ